MFSAKMNARLAGLALAGAVLAAPVAAMAGVVVKSTGPSSSKYPVGAKVEDTSTITLKAGDSLTVLTARGTKVMKGAGTFKVGERPKATRQRFSAITRTRAANRVRIGSSRSAASGAPITNPSVWYVDVTKSGTVCLNDLETVRFWRPDSAALATYSLSRSSSADSINVTFDAKDAVAPIDPALMTVASGDTFSITGPGDGAESVQVTLVKIDGETQRADQLAETFIGAGCMVQVAQLADRLGE